MSKKQLAPANNYEVGYGKPPNTTRFAKGQSGNPLGRPKGSKTKRSKARDIRLNNMIIEEAYRSVAVQEDGGMISMTMMQAVLRSLTVNAAKGDHRSQKLLMDMIRIVEATKDEQKESEEEIQINVVFEGNDSRSRLK
jgi:hypothetical protein